MDDYSSFISIFVETRKQKGMRLEKMNINNTYPKSRNHHVVVGRRVGH